MATKSSLRNKKVLITCGPTWVPIDPVRVISNSSSGKLGHLIAETFQKQGAAVTLLEGPTTHIFSNKAVKVLKFWLYGELKKLVRQQLSESFDIVVHAAAVSDYKVKNSFRSKLRSQISNLTLALKPTVKIIDQIKKYKPRTFLVGFKLESHIDNSSFIPMVKNLFTKSKCDLVVINSDNNKKYTGHIIDKKGAISTTIHSREAMAKKLVQSVRAKI